MPGLVNVVNAGRRIYCLTSYGVFQSFCKLQWVTNDPFLQAWSNASLIYHASLEVRGFSICPVMILFSILRYKNYRQPIQYDVELRSWQILSNPILLEGNL
jgi:hypothetical protein